MKPHIALILFALALSGCGQIDFRKSELSGVTGNKIALFLLATSQGADESNDQLDAFKKNNPELMPAISEACGGVRKGAEARMPPAFIPIIAAGAKLLFDLAIDAQARKLEELKKAAEASYSEKIFITANEFKNAECALIVRYKEGEPAPGLTALIRLDKQKDGNTFAISPRYIKANNARAVTMENTKDAPIINISVAVSTKVLAKHRSGIASIFPAGEGVTSVPKIGLGPKAKTYRCITQCPTSDLVAYPADNDVLSVTFAVTESGEIGFDIDQSIAELKAIKEALGPALSDAAKEASKKKDE